MLLVVVLASTRTPRLASLHSILRRSQGGSSNLNQVKDIPDTDEYDWEEFDGDVSSIIETLSNHKNSQNAWDSSEIPNKWSETYE
jgi:hypothetical protein